MQDETTKEDFTKVKSGDYYNLGNVAYFDEVTKHHYRYFKGTSERMLMLVSMCVIAGLFNPGWNMIHIYMKIMRGQMNDAVIVAVHRASILVVQKQLIGVGILHQGRIEIFVNKDSRRIGIGSAIIRLLKRRGNSVRNADEGEPQSLPFWKKNNIRCDVRT